MPTVTRRATATGAAVCALAAVLAGCSGTGGAPATGGATTPGGASQVAVTLVSEGGTDACKLDTTTVAAGPVTFTVTNESSAALSEVELLDDERIRGEKENLAPGLDPVSFTVTLGGGTYQLYCPGADTELQDITVEGEAAAAPTGGVQDVLAEGAQGYAAYVVDQTSAMVQAVGTLVDAIDAGDLDAAKAAYGAARPYYERIESSVEGFVMPGADPTDNATNLDYLLDMRASNLDDAVGWHGFHAIERDLWQGGAITDQTKAYAAELATNVKTLADTVVPTLTYLPEDLANGAAGLIEEVETNKITGEEEDYSHLDLVDFAGNVEGARQAFANLKPGLDQIDPDLTKQVATQFEAVQQLVDGYRDASAVGGYVAYTESLRTSDQAKLTAAIQALHEPLSQIAEKVATAA